jgi:hypothetical protein
MKRQHKVRIKLHTNDIWDITSRVNEVSKIRDWVGSQCGWDPDKFEFKIHSMGAIMDVWFEEKQDAVMCTLRWA